MRFPAQCKASFATQSEVITSMVINSNKLITASDDGQIRIYDAARGTHLQTRNCHADGVSAMALAENWLVTGAL